MNNQKVSKKAGRRRVTFSFYAPRANKVMLLGDFNNWKVGTSPMKKNTDGLWQKISYLHPGRYEYRFLVDGKWYCDPRILKRCRNCFGSENTVIEVEDRR